MLDEVLGQFADYGLEPEQPLILGKLTRCKTSQDKGKEKNGWYVVHEHRTEKNETLIFGSFGDWRSGESQKIKVKAGRMSAEEREVMRARQEDAKRRAAEIAANSARRAANRAAGLFKRMPEKGRSDYLGRKQIVGFGVRYAPRTGAFLVPMCNVRDQIVGLQVVFPTKQEDTGRDKSYWPYGMSKEGAFHLIGPHPDQYLSKYDTGNLAAKLGNTPAADGDGQRYRGRGLIQVTGHDNYLRCSLALFGDERLLRTPELLELPQWATESAAWFWSVNGLNALADQNEFNTITRRINGGLNGLQDRLELWERARAVLCVSAN